MLRQCSGLLDRLDRHQGLKGVLLDRSGKAYNPSEHDENFDPLENGYTYYDPREQDFWTLGRFDGDQEPVVCYRGRQGGHGYRTHKRSSLVRLLELGGQILEPETRSVIAGPDGRWDPQNLVTLKPCTHLIETNPDEEWKKLLVDVKKWVFSVSDWELFFEVDLLDRRPADCIRYLIRVEWFIRRFEPDGEALFARYIHLAMDRVDGSVEAIEFAELERYLTHCRMVIDRETEGRGADWLNELKETFNTFSGRLNGLVLSMHYWSNIPELPLAFQHGSQLTLSKELDRISRLFEESREMLGETLRCLQEVADCEVKTEMQIQSFRFPHGQQNWCITRARLLTPQILDATRTYRLWADALGRCKDPQDKAELAERLYEIRFARVREERAAVERRRASFQRVAERGRYEKGDSQAFVPDSDNYPEWQGARRTWGAGGPDDDSDHDPFGDDGGWHDDNEWDERVGYTPTEDDFRRDPGVYMDEMRFPPPDDTLYSPKGEED